ncbi:MAG: response regulator [Planctomycetota bacterium]|jgi:DNA-binding response OmpR family regulator
MKILIAEDDPVARRLVERTVGDFGHDAVVVEDGLEAWKQLQSEDYDVVISDWIMPGIDGLELCRRIRTLKDHPFIYVLLLTARYARADIVEAIMAGADDFMVKPFDRELLRARLHAARRVVRLQRDHALRAAELRQALDEVKTLRGLLPVCSKCRRIRRDESVWQAIESYLLEHQDLDFARSICPSCYEKEGRPSPGDTGTAGGSDEARASKTT